MSLKCYKDKYKIKIFIFADQHRSEKMNIHDRALESYVMGNAFRKAVDIAKKVFPHAVVDLEE